MTPTARSSTPARCIFAGLLLSALCPAQTSIQTPTDQHSSGAPSIAVSSRWVGTPKFPQPWQRMQMPTAAEVARTWLAPPPEYGPEPYYSINGPVTREVFARDMDTVKALGFHAVTVQPGRGNIEPYLSPAYFAMFRQLVEEAKKRDLRVWIIDDAGYPSGFAGGLISEKTPNLRMQALTLAERLPVQPGQTLTRAVDPATVAATAINQAADRIPIPVTAGSITWTAPAAGTWTVLLVSHVFRTSPTASATNLTHKKDDSQALEDYMDPAATAAWIGFTHEGYYRAMPEEFGRTILGFRGDEPDYSIAGLPWTPAFFDRFQQSKGYNIRPYLAAMLLATPGRGETALTLTAAELRAKADYYDVFSQLFRDGFFQPQAAWCAAHGIEYQVHLNHEEMELQLVHSEGEFFRDMRYVQVPGIDAIWHQVFPDTIADYPRLASSAAHLYGHPRAFTESFGAYRPAPDLALARYVFDEQIVRGINLTEGMSFSATAPRPPAPDALTVAAETGLPTLRPHLPAAMADPGWPALMDHVRRLSYVMSLGRPAASVALYLPSSSLWLGDTAADTAFVSTERMLSERQIDFDILSLDALATDLKAGPGNLETLSGNQFRTILLPSLAVLSQAELDRLRTFAQPSTNQPRANQPGGKVLFLGRTPSLIYTRTLLDARASTPADFAWATVETSAQLAPTPTPPGQPPAAPPEPQVVPAAIEAALTTLLGTRDRDAAVALDTPDPALKVMTRQLKDASVFLFFNEGPTASTHTLTLTAAGHTAELWNSDTGTITRLPATASHGNLAVKLPLAPYQTGLILVRQD